MNIARVVVLGIAVMAAGGAIVVVRAGMGANKARKPVATEATAAEDVLVAAINIDAGHTLSPEWVRWQPWPKTAVDVSFITKTKQPNTTKAVTGLIPRSRLVPGEPITDANTVRANTPGFMAAILSPGMRAISVSVSPQTSAGGFILPNDRVDVLLTRDMGANNAKNFQTETLLKDVRVLAVDQTIVPEKDHQSVVGHTATLELSLEQSELMAKSEESGVISLALRSLGDSDGMPVTVVQPRPKLPPAVASALAADVDRNNVRVYRAGVLQGGGGGAAPGAGSQQAQAIPGALGAGL